MENFIFCAVESISKSVLKDPVQGHVMDLDVIIVNGFYRDYDICD